MTTADQPAALSASVHNVSAWWVRRTAPCAPPAAGRPRPSARPPSAAAAGPSQPAGPNRVGKGTEIGSRVFYGDFWALVAVVATVAASASFGDNPGAGMIGLVIAVLAGLYARYIFRGGRSRHSGRTTPAYPSEKDVPHHVC